MSQGFYPVFERKIAKPKSDILGESLLSNVEELDRISRKAKLSPFTIFADNRSIPDDFQGDPEELEDILGEWTEWFDSSEGSAVMRALANHIQSKPQAVKRLNDPDSVSNELLEIATFLDIAAKKGIRFRLEVM